MKSFHLVFWPLHHLIVVHDKAKLLLLFSAGSGYNLSEGHFSSCCQLSRVLIVKPFAVDLL